jgi:hypothetical protein
VEREPLLCHIPFLLLTFYYLPPNLNPTNLMILKFIPVHNLKKKKKKANERLESDKENNI